MSKIKVVGIGPGSESDITPAAIDAIESSDIIVGYKYYFRFIEKYISTNAQCIDTGMKKEKERAEIAFNYAIDNKNVCVISSGDAGIYGMAPLILEMKKQKEANIDIEVIPGISAFQKAASLLGAPIGNDMCIISLSDLMTPWEKIEKRIIAAAYADFVTAIYNPKSNGRYWQLHRLKELFLKERSGQTPIGYVRQAGREEQSIEITNLNNFNPDTIDMFTVIIIGNSQSYIYNDKIITPRGYYTERNDIALEGGLIEKPGRTIMIKSFKTIESQLKNKNIPIDKKWALLHAIHTTADFDMEELLSTSDNAVENIYNKLLKDSSDKTIITDVTMAASGIRKGALERLGIQVKCYLNDKRVAQIASEKNITRSQAGIQLAVEEHPQALYVFGNAPTALMELCSHIANKKAKPLGVIAAPVGFVHVEESKHMIKAFKSIDKVIIEGKKGGSNIAATLVNAILCLNDSIDLRPGRDL